MARLCTVRFLSAVRLVRRMWIRYYFRYRSTSGMLQHEGSVAEELGIRWCGWGRGFPATIRESTEKRSPNRSALHIQLGTVSDAAVLSDTGLACRFDGVC